MSEHAAKRLDPEMFTVIAPAFHLRRLLWHINHLQPFIVEAEQHHRACSCASFSSKQQTGYMYVSIAVSLGSVLSLS